MDAKTQLLKLAEEIKAKSNTIESDATPEYIMGKAAVEGICYLRGGATRNILHLTRKDGVITVTDSEIRAVNEIKDGRVITTEVTTDTILLQVSL